MGGERPLGSLVETLCAASRERPLNPYELIAWPERLGREQWFMSPELVSLEGTEVWEGMSEPARQQLSFFEAVNFFSLNIHGEKSLVEGLTQRLYRAEQAAFTPYLHHFLDEENKHMVYFGGFCTRYAGKIYPDRKMAVERDTAEGEEDFLFFARVLIFEEIVDVYNVTMAGDERLHPLARQLNALHHQEETRHLAFGRRLVRELFGGLRTRWSAETVRGVRAYLAAYLASTWKEYANPSAYEDAGIPDPYGIRDRAFAHPASRERRRRVSRGCVRRLIEAGVLEEEPAL